MENFLSYYEKYTKEVLATTPPIWEYYGHTEPGELQESIKSAFTTWEMSYTLLEDTEYGTYKCALLSLLAFFDENDISEELFQVYDDEASKSSNVLQWGLLFSHGGKNVWPGKKFSQIILEFRRLSLIASGMMKSDGFIHISLHPLVKDWIKLRQSSSATIENFQTASRVLVHSLVQSFSLLPNDQLYGDPTFCLPVYKSAYFLAHVSAWQANFRQFQQNIHPTLIHCPELGVQNALELVFAEFLRQSYLLEDAVDLLRWVWDHYDGAEEHTMLARARAGCSLVEILVLLRKEPEAERCGWHLVAHWKLLSAYPEYTDATLYRIAVSLNRTGHISKNLEAEALIREILERTGENLGNPVKLYAFWAEIADSLQAQDNLAKTQEARSIIRHMVETSFRTGDVNHRTESWVFRAWCHAIRFNPDLEIADTLSLEFLKYLSRNYGENHQITVIARQIRSRILIRSKRYAEAETLIATCVWDLRNASPMDNTRPVVCETYGDLLMGAGKYNKACSSFLEALQVGPVHDLSTNMRLLGSYSTCAKYDENLLAAESALQNRLTLLEIEKQWIETKVTTMLALARVKIKIGGGVRLSEATQHLDNALELLRPKLLPVGEGSADSGTCPLRERSEIFEERQYHSYFEAQTERHFEFEFTILLAVALIQRGNVVRAEQCFQDSKLNFERMECLSACNVEMMLFWSSRYVEVKVERGMDKESLRAYVDWATTKGVQKITNGQEREKVLSALLNNIQPLEERLNPLKLSTASNLPFDHLDHVEISPHSFQLRTNKRRYDLSKLFPFHRK